MGDWSSDVCSSDLSDIIAAIVTTIVFMFKFNNILSENE